MAWGKHGHETLRRLVSKAARYPAFPPVVIVLRTWCRANLSLGVPFFRVPIECHYPTIIATMQSTQVARRSSWEAHKNEAASDQAGSPPKRHKPYNFADLGPSTTIVSTTLPTNSNSNMRARTSASTRPLPKPMPCPTSHTQHNGVDELLDLMERHHQPSLNTSAMEREDSGVDMNTAATQATDGYSYMGCNALHSILQWRPEQLLMLDCRAGLGFKTSSIKGAVSVQYSGLMLRRLRKQGHVRIQLKHLQVSDEAAVAKRSDPNTLVVVYDEDSTVVEPEGNAAILLRILESEGVKAVFLKGGITAHRRLYAQDLTDTDTSRPSGRAHLHPVLKAVPRLATVPATVVFDHLVLGNQHQGTDPAFLARNRITHVINVTETPFANGLPNLVRCMQIPLLDGAHHDLLSVVPEALRFIEGCRREHGRVLVYCSNGYSRAVAVVMAYMMATRSYNYDAALQLLQAIRPRIAPHDSFLKQLRDFQSFLSNAQTPERDIKLRPSVGDARPRALFRN
ncbi:uncharacterized protein MONBRDRAFT_4822 [Monosiga brevicollis MX1]|uniref:protein-tyrosine-phosphatase n=1 Tax=Monosiga brevicollis TaxID=81824 RepID=A9UP16_MONBE|nr:uncharacterized protein MONBRDRAFT_4822 [Monosiga brevicollis MX1]EDQ92796.1 predicted protein [Monosiga brevicollis MX1]|eukprot:XP_001742558.1 hypothetical protein [Monosiga brevicollis MX1]